MNKKNLTRVAGLSAAAMLALSGMAMAETTESALVKGGALNLRETASLDAKVLGQYPTGTLVEIIKAGSEWHRVSVNGKTGYMLAKYLNSADSAISATVRTNTGTGLNLREQPNMNGTIIMAVPIRYFPHLQKKRARKHTKYLRHIRDRILSVKSMSRFMTVQRLLQTSSTRKAFS